MERPTFVLGAGFSRAISKLMPLTDELGSACRDVLPPTTPGPPRELRGGFFELWLSQLAEEQPYLNTQQNLINQATFVAYSSAIAEVLERRTDRILRDGSPSWLASFVKAAHLTRATLATFNYDTLIECAVATGLLYEWGMYSPVYWAELTGDVPAWPAGAGRLAAERADTFRLLKLHGSLNWYWVPGDQSGATMARRQVPGIFGAAARYSEADRQRELPGRVPFIVPPSAAKSSYYRNPITHEVWQQTALSLSLAADIVFMGYSLPLTDLTFGSMFRDTAALGSARITVVDRDPAPILTRLQNIGIHEPTVRTFGGEKCVADFVTSWIRDLGAAAVADLRTSDGSAAPMFVAWERERASAVVGISMHGTEAVLRLGPVCAPGLLGRRADAMGDLMPDLPTPASIPNGTSLVLVELPDEGRQTVIGTGSATFDTGYRNWNTLFTSRGAPAQPAS